MFKSAERVQVKLKLAITGPSGSGKTFSALRLATGLGGKIAVVDTENGSASLYADKFTFDVLTMQPPFTTEKYEEAIVAAAKAGYTTLIIDSITHAWAGEGGLLEQKEQLDSRGGRQNTYTNWASITKKQEAFKSKLLHAPIHVIATMRSKQEYVLQEKDGKQVPRKMGMAPIQREGMEYEFTTVFDIAMNNEAEASKDRTSLFAGKIFKITEETGKQFVAWLAGGKPEALSILQPIAHGPKRGPHGLTEQMLEDLRELSQKLNWPKDQVVRLCQITFDKAEPWHLSPQECDILVNHMKANPPPKVPA